MRPRRQDLNVIFFTFMSCRQLDGRQAPCRPLGGDSHPFFKFPYSTYIFEILFFFKYKNEKKASLWAKRNLVEERRARAASSERKPIYLSEDIFSM